MAEVHITIATGWVEGRTSLDVAHETRLVKSALLYADRVTLASPRVAMLSQFATILVADEHERAVAALQMVQAMPDSAQLTARVNALSRKKRKTVDERFFLRDLERQLQETGNELAEKVEQILTEAGVAELAAAMGAGVVDLNPLGADKPDGINQMVYRLSDLLGEVVAPGATTYPLLDESTSSLLRSMIREGIVPDANLAGTAEPALATSWIGGLDAFPDAEIETVLEAREELRGPLVRFRAAVLEVTRELESTPLDDGWQRVADEAYRRHVEPALQELREAAEERKVLSLLRRAAVGDAGKKALAAGLGFLGASSAAIPGMLGAAMGAGGEVITAMVARRRELAEKERANGFLFLFEADKRFAH